MLRRVALVRTEVSEELSASFIRVTRICELVLFLVYRFLSVHTRATWRNIPDDTILKKKGCSVGIASPILCGIRILSGLQKFANGFSHQYVRQIKTSIFWDKTDVSGSFDNYLMLVSCLAYSSTLKMKSTRSSETSVAFQRSARLSS
jgi:hypothetical protein